MLEHIERLKTLQAINLPKGIERHIHQNRLLKIAREGHQMTAADLARFETQRRYATLVALVIEGTATVTDEIIDLHDRIIGKLLNTAKHKHQQQFHESGKSINDKVLLYGRIGKALLAAKENDSDAFAAIESVISCGDVTHWRPSTTCICCDDYDACKQHAFFGFLEQYLYLYNFKRTNRVGHHQRGALPNRARQCL